MSIDALAILGPCSPESDAAPRKSDRAALGFAQDFVSQTEGEFDVLSIGPHAGSWLDAVRRFGARKVYVADHHDLQPYTAEGYEAAAAQHIAAHTYRCVVAATTSPAREFLPRLAARLDAPMATDVVALGETTPEAVRLTRAVFVGNLLATVEMRGPNGVVTCRPSEFTGSETSEMSPHASVELNSPLVHARKSNVVLEAACSTRPDLKEAEVVVSIGRGAKGDEGVALAGELADCLGGALGATRAVVDAGWLPNELQVGQTGKIVAPDVYIAIGLSGSIQHLAGMRNSKFIVAINKDPDAPIFGVADIGLVADLFQAVPELTRQLRQREKSHGGG